MPWASTGKDLGVVDVSSSVPDALRSDDLRPGVSRGTFSAPDLLSLIAAPSDDDTINVTGFN
jgi:hypothetical protein